MKRSRENFRARPISQSTVPHSGFKFCLTMTVSEREIEKARCDVNFTNEGPIPKLVYSDEQKTVTLDAGFLEGSGSGRNDGCDTVIYKREVLCRQIVFMKESVITRGNTGYIFGASGVGTSIATYYFAATICGDWDTIWVHRKAQKVPGGPVSYNCIEISEGTKYISRDHRSESMEEYLKSKKAAARSRNCLLVLDGYFGALYEVKLLQTCHDWLNEKGRFLRRFILTASFLLEDSEALKAHPHDSFLVYSWTLAEYQEACRNKDLWESVKKFMDA